MVIGEDDLQQWRAEVGRNPSVMSDGCADWIYEHINERTSGGAFLLPDRFAGEFNAFTRSAHYQPSPDSLLLRVQERGKPRVQGPDGIDPAGGAPGRSSSSRAEFLEMIGKVSSGAFGGFESARLNGSETEIERAVRRGFLAVRGARQQFAGDAVAKFLEIYPEQRLIWGGLTRRLLRGRMSPEEEEATRNFKLRAVSAFAPSMPGLGAGLFPIPIGDLWDLLLTYGAYGDLGVRRMVGEYERYPEVTALPSTVVASPTYQGTYVIPADNTMTGTALWRAANTFACLLQISREWLQDVTIDIASGVIAKVIPALAKSVDYCAFLGNGNDDLTNGAMTGIFQDQNIKSYQCAAAGTTSVLNLALGDLMGVVGTVTPAALQRPCRWYISPAFLPQLAMLKDGAGDTYLLRSPSYTGGEWELARFPVTWTAVGPSLNEANQKVAAFGQPGAYLVALRETLDLEGSEGAMFAQNLRDLRAILRGNCTTRDAAGFATLTLSAQ